MPMKYSAHVLDIRRSTNLWGITHPPLPLKLWRWLFCPRGWHLFDEVWSIEFGRELVCDPCQLVVMVSSVDETWQE